MKRAHPFGAEVIATLFYVGLAVFYTTTLTLWQEHGFWHWADWAVAVVCELSALNHGAKAWRLFRDGVEAR